jgi:hypothetical protein
LSGKDLAEYHWQHDLEFVGTKKEQLCQDLEACPLVLCGVSSNPSMSSEFADNNWDCGNVTTALMMYCRIAKPDKW